MDAFFAAVEQRDFPEYRNKPIAIGYNVKRSVVSTASYEARKYGVHSAMPVSIALRKCPELIIVPPRYEVYKNISTTIRAIFHEYTDLVEPLSIDEAYLDVTHPKKGKNSASLIAMEIKKRIKDETNLIASAGVSYNKFLAKVASDQDKPDGFFLITPKDATAFLENLDIGLFYGIGKVTEQKMHNMKIYKGRDLKKLNLEQLKYIFGKAGEYYYDVVRGIDNRPVIPFRERKSIGVERTYREDISDLNVIKDKLEYIIDLLLERMNKEQKRGKTLTLKIKYPDFTNITRSISKDEIFLEKENLVNLAYSLLPYEEIKEKKVRLIGVSISNFISNKENEIKKKPIQLSINFDVADSNHFK